jgi:hypothetical protein
MAFVTPDNAIYVCSLAAGGAWSSPPTLTYQFGRFSPSLAVSGETLYLVFAADNSISGGYAANNDLYLCSLNANGSWSAAIPVNQSTSAAPSAVAFGSSGLTVGFTANDPGGQVLFAFTENPSVWDSGDVYIQQQSLAGPGVTIAPIAYNPVSPGPSAGNNNYLITNYDISYSLENVTVTLVAVQDLVNTNTNDSNGKPATTGFGFQLNCQPPGTVPGTGPYPPAGQPVWEQYLIQVQGQQFSMGLDYGPSEGTVPDEQYQNLFLLPTANTIPQGYKISMKLETDPATNNVIRFWVNAWDNGNPIMSTAPSSTDYSQNPKLGPWFMTAPTDWQAPIVNIQLNACGYIGGEYAFFEAGVQSFPLVTFSYQSDRLLMVQGATNTETAENSNLTFGPLAEYPTNPIVQVGYVS